MERVNKDDYILTQLSNGEWDVFNEVKGIRYAVRKGGDHWECNCPHWYHRLRKSKGVCKHISFVKEALGDRRI